MKAHKSARKHEISEDAGIYAAEHHVYVADLDDNVPARQFRLGFDPNGRLLELVIADGVEVSTTLCCASTAKTRHEGPTSVR